MRLPTDELLALVDRLVRGALSADDLMGMPDVGEDDKRDALALGLYVLRQRIRRAAERAGPAGRAMALFRSFLTEAQRAELRRRRAIRIVGSAGGLYRLQPTTGSVGLLERHGSRWYEVVTYCLHDAPVAADEPVTRGLAAALGYGAAAILAATGGRMPPADLSLAHMLLLLADEGEFRRLANATDRRSETLWNGAWLRRCRASRRAAAAA